MGILSKIGRYLLRNEVTTGMSVEQLLREMSFGSATHAGESVSPDSAMRCAAVYACVRVLAESKAQLPCPVYKYTKNNGREKDKSIALYSLLNIQPNPWQTAFEFHEMMMGHCALRGNAYAYVGRDFLTNEARQLIPLNPKSVKPIQTSDLTVDYIYTRPDGTQKTFKQSEMLHIRGIAIDGVEGIAPITAYANATGLSLAAEKHQGKSFSSGVKFPGVLTTPADMTPEAVAEIREQFNALHSGDNAHKAPLLTNGLDWKSVGMTADDAQIIETRKMQRSEIASIFRVPPHMIGDLDRATFSNIEHQSIEFVTHSMMPWLRRFEQAYARDLLTEKQRETHFVEHLVDSLMRGDTISRYTANGLAIRDGWKNRNEVRTQENMNPAPGLDEFILPLNMQTSTQQAAK